MKHKTGTKALSWLLTLALMLGLLPGLGGTALAGFTAAAPYRLYVGGTQVTSSNAADVFGDGKVSYNAESNTLTLKGYSNGGSYYIEEEAGVYEADYRIAAGVYYAGAEKLTVALLGNNVLTMPEFSKDKLDNAAFFSKGDVEFTGTGSLNATGGNASDTSENSNVGSYGLCAIGENAAFTGSGAVTFTAGSGESSYGAYFGKETAVAFSGGTVTMTGGTSTGGSYGMYCGRVEVTGGKVQVTGGEAGIFSFGIYCWRDISVTGGTLTATGGSAANSSYGIRGIRETGCDIVVSGGTLNAVGGSAAKESCGIYSDWGGVDVSGGKVTAEGGAVTGEGGRSCGISNSMHSINVEKGTLIAKGGSVTGSGGKSIGLYSSVGPIYFEERASVSCLGGTVTGENGESFGINCFGSYIWGGEIAATGGNAAYSCGYYDKMALLVDAGTFTATGGEGKRSHGIYNRDYVELNGGTVTAVGGSGSEESCGIYLATRQYSNGTSKGTTLTVTGGEVSATGGSCGVFCDPATDGKGIVITGGVTTAAGNTAISRAPILGADVTASGSTSTNGSSPAEYSEASNDTYKWFKTETAAGEKTPITKVAFTVEEPVAGAEPTETVQVAAVPEGALSITEYKAVWLEADDSLNFVPMTSKLFEAGKHYTVEAPNEKNAGAPLIALTKPGYVLPIEYEKEPVYTLNGEETFMVTPYFDPFGPLEEVEYGVSVSPAELRFSAYTGYSEEDSALHREITASNTGNGKVKFILAGFTESSMDEQFGLIVDGMTATVYPKEGLTQGTYTATVRIEDVYSRFDTIEVPVTFTVYTRSTAPSCPKDETCPLTAFTDLNPAKWYHDGVEYCLENGLMVGVDDSRFSPKGTTSRRMIVSILYRLEGEPEVTAEIPFNDVEAGTWYTDAVIWAAENEIVSGYEDGTFGPKREITRQQLASILYRYAQFKGIDVSAGEDTNILSFADAANVSDWANTAMKWAVGSGILAGKDGNRLDPKGTATRAEAAAMIQRFCVNVAK